MIIKHYDSKMKKVTFFCILFLLVINHSAWAQHEDHTVCVQTAKMNKTPERIINLFVGYKMVNYAGKWLRAIAVNDQIRRLLCILKKRSSDY